MPNWKTCRLGQSNLRFKCEKRRYDIVYCVLCNNGNFPQFFASVDSPYIDYFESTVTVRTVKNEIQQNHEKFVGSADKSRTHHETE